MAIGPVGTTLTPVGGGLAPAKPSTSTTASSEKGTFGDTLTGLIESVETSAGGANTAISKMLNGTGDVYEAMLALNKAQTTLELTVQVRNKLVQAYQDVMRMPI